MNFRSFPEIPMLVSVVILSTVSRDVPIFSTDQIVVTGGPRSKRRLLIDALLISCTYVPLCWSSFMLKGQGHIT